jgi:hypothetical protein
LMYTPAPLSASTLSCSCCCLNHLRRLSDRQNLVLQQEQQEESHIHGSPGSNDYASSRAASKLLREHSQPKMGAFLEQHLSESL